MQMLARLSIVLLVVGSGLLGRAEIDDPLYHVYVALESEDAVALLEFDGTSLTVSERFEVGYLPGEIEGPHGLALTPDGANLFVSMAHGNPFGSVLKIRTDTHEQTGTVQLGLFPATMAVSAESGLLFVSNFNLHGDHETSSVSIVDPERMVELGRIDTGIMPHGGRFGPDGKAHYSVSMMDGRLHVLDASTLKLVRSVALSEFGSTSHRPKPTWVSPHPDGRRVYVANNGRNQILELEAQTGKLIRVFDTPAGPYNLDVSPDGSYLAATYKGDDSTGIWDLARGTEENRIANSAPIPHGVVFSPDGRYVFVTCEGVGTTSGALDVVEVESGSLIASAKIGQQPGGIVFWKSSAESIEQAPSQ